MIQYTLFSITGGSIYYRLLVYFCISSFYSSKCRCRAAEVW